MVGGLTVDSGQQHSGMVVCYHIGISVLWFVHLQVGVLPCKLLPWVHRLLNKTNVMIEHKQNMHRIIHHIYFHGEQVKC